MKKLMIVALYSAFAFLSQAQHIHAQQEVPISQSIAYPTEPQMVHVPEAVGMLLMMSSVRSSLLSEMSSEGVGDNFSTTIKLYSSSSPYATIEVVENVVGPGEDHNKPRPKRAEIQGSLGPSWGANLSEEVTEIRVNSAVAAMLLDSEIVGQLVVALRQYQEVAQNSYDRMTIVAVYRTPAEFASRIAETGTTGISAVTHRFVSKWGYTIVLAPHDRTIRTDYQVVIRAGVESSLANGYSISSPEVTIDELGDIRRTSRLSDAANALRSGIVDVDPAKFSEHGFVIPKRHLLDSEIQAVAHLFADTFMRYVNANPGALLAIDGNGISSTIAHTASVLGWDEAIKTKITEAGLLDSLLWEAAERQGVFTVESVEAIVARDIGKAIRRTVR